MHQRPCAPDRFHGRTVEEAIARLDGAGIRFDRETVRATGMCPLCGCPMAVGPDLPRGEAGGAP